MLRGDNAADNEMSQPYRPTVCHVLHSLEIGGAEMLARRFAVSLQSEFRPVFACLDSLGTLGMQLRAAGIPVCVLERRAGLDVRCAVRLERWLREERVDLVHAHQYTPFFYSSIARVMARRIPVLFTEHGRHHPDARHWKRVLANRFLLRPGDHVVAVGEHVRNALISNEGFPPKRVEVIYNGVDAGTFQDRYADRFAVRAELGYTKDQSIIIQVARLNRLKDHRTAIRAISELSGSHSNARLLLVGDGEERRSLEELVESLGLRAFVRFLGARTDVPRLLRAADIFLLTSISEGIPLTLVEAMLARVPVVATRVGGVPEIIVDGQCGLLADPGDACGIAQRLNQLLACPTLGGQLKMEGRRRAERLFSEQSMIEAYRRAYKRLQAPVCNGGKAANEQSRRGILVRSHNASLMGELDEIDAAQHPRRVSIIIPAYNEETFLPACLQSVSDQKSSARGEICEVIVADNQSTDMTCTIARSFGARIVGVQPGYPGRARNAGARIAEGDILAFVDADCVLPPEWLDYCLETLADNRVVATAVPQAAPEHDSTWVERAWFQLTKPARGITTVRWLPAFNFVLRREQFVQLNGFDESLRTCEDSDLSFRLSQYGSLILDGRICAKHLGESSTVWQSLRREMWRSAGNFNSAVRRGAVRNEMVSIAVPLAFLFALLSGIILLCAGFLLTSLFVAGGLLIASTMILPFAIAMRKGIYFWRQPLLFIQAYFLLLVYLSARAVGTLVPCSRLARNSSSQSAVQSHTLRCEAHCR
jgi:glycosyltransferase involved in cell wall biosynthesis